MVIEHPTCIWPGCSQKSMDCDAHHIEAFSKGGKTTASNRGPLCFVHHPKLHREGWALIRQPDGRVHPVPWGHPDHPGTGLTPEDYLRKERVAILGHRLRKAARIAPQRQPRAGP
jgi:hypothetical protein